MPEVLYENISPAWKSKPQPVVGVVTIISYVPNDKLTRPGQTS